MNQRCVNNIYEKVKHYNIVACLFEQFLPNKIFIKNRKVGPIPQISFGLTPLIALIWISVEPAVMQKCVASVTYLQ